MSKKKDRQAELDYVVYMKSECLEEGYAAGLRAVVEMLKLLWKYCPE